ncbi:MAG: hypothetical protein KJZ86_04035 [Caldilineaceae bacterium]|nr:hypothetical protein [Caldilineaceae bacterium]HRJ43485.1 hypothetical protein [Caldilineaceae bacterium]
MSEQTIAVEIPQTLYHRLLHLAEITQRPISTLVVQAIDQNVPPLLEKMPSAMQKELADLELLPDDRLWAVARSRVSADQQSRYAELMDKNRTDGLSGSENAEFESLYHSFDVHMLRKAFAAGLLRWRGYALPSPAHLTDLN